MKKDVTIYHKISRILVGVVFLVLLAAGGCSNVLMKSPAAPEAAGPGGGVKVTLRLFTGSARTVMPEMDLLTWHITAEQGTDNIEATGTYPTYTLELPTVGRWIFTVKGINPTGDEIFTGSVAQKIGGGSTVSISIPLSPGSAMAAGTGQINLTLKVPDTVGTVMYKLDSDTEFTDLTPSNGSCSLNKAGVSAGPHTLSLYFLDERGTTLYMCTEAVNVWNGMTSSQWINTGNIGYITGNGEFELTDVIIDAFLNTMGSVVYVNDSVAVNAPATGSIFAPVNSVSTAVDILRKANPDGNYNGTIMVSGATTIDQEIEVKNGETLTVKGTGENASITNNAGRVFNIASGGSLTLGENITLTGTVTDGNGGAVYVNDGTFTMDAGSKITGGQAAYGGGVYVANGIFTMDGGTISENSASGTGASGGGVCISGGTFTMSGGAVISKNSAGSSGGGVFVSGSGDFTMTGGTIGGTGGGSPNSAENGGGVYIHNGTFTMSGSAVISGNNASSSSSSSSGGGVYIHNGTFTMCDSAVISGNSATSSGGGVYVYATGKFTMEGGTIGGSDTASANSSVSGGGVCVYKGYFTMSDGSISGNSATKSGGGVFVQGGTFTMEGGTIGGAIANTATSGNGGGIYLDSTGGTVTLNNTSSISGNAAAFIGSGVYVAGGTFTVSGSSPTITDNADSNVYLASGKTITIGEDGLAGGEIGVTAEEMKPGTAVQITDKNVNNAASIFTSDEKGYRIEENVNVSSGGTAVFLSDTETSYSTGGNGGVSLGDFNDAFKAIESTGGDITVFKPVEITEPTTIFPSSGVTIDITASGATTVFEVQDGGRLTLGGGDGEVNVSGDPSASSPTADGEEISLINISNGGTVTIEKNANIQNNQAGRGVTVDNGRLIMTGGSIKGNTGGYSYGSGVYVSGQDASFEMSGGEISDNTLKLNNTSNRQGAGVMVCNGATFTLSNNGKITGNSGYEGVGVTVSGSTFTMNGGEISDNNGSGTSGGVYLVSYATMNMNGGTIIGNKAKMSSGAGGVYIGSSCTFTGSTDPDTTASITENYVANTNVDVYFQSGGNGAYSPGNVQVGNPQNP